MKILKNIIINTFFVAIMMMTILLCYSSQAHAAQDGDYEYIVTGGKAQITSPTGEAIIEGDITIPSTLGGYPVTSIGNGAFSERKLLTSISLPQGVTSIGSDAFLYCEYLTSVSLPQGVTSIGDRAFSSCVNLASISLPQGVTSIGNGAFDSCRSITSISLPQGIIRIGDGTFWGCKGLISISIPGVTSIGKYAFRYCTSLTSISIPQGVTSISETAFSDCTSLTSISLPHGVTSISDEAFKNCRGLTSISLPQEVMNIGKNAFQGCSSLKSISIPQGVTSISNSTFSDCTGLTSISLLQGLKTIGIDAFKGCTRLTTISIPKGVSSINKGAFSNCMSLISIRFNFAPTLIYDDPTTIPDTARIIGYDPSSAKAYAAKYYREFEAIVIITGVSLNKNVTTIVAGGYETLSATITPDNVTDKSVTWSVSSQSGSNIATVSNTGVVTAVNPGTAVIRATSNDDATKYAECSVTVTAIKTVVSVASLSDINVANGTQQANVGLPSTVQATLNEGSTQNVSVTWDGGNPAYNATTAGTYTFKGTLAMPTGMINPNSLTETVRVIVAEPAPVTLKGDINRDGTVNILDVVQAVNFALDKNTPTTAQFNAADINSDGFINILDAVQIVNKALGR